MIFQIFYWRSWNSWSSSFGSCTMCSSWVTNGFWSANSTRMWCKVLLSALWLMRVKKGMLLTRWSFKAKSCCTLITPCAPDLYLPSCFFVSQLVSFSYHVVFIFVVAGRSVYWWYIIVPIAAVLALLKLALFLCRFAYQCFKVCLWYNVGEKEREREREGEGEMNRKRQTKRAVKKGGRERGRETQRGREGEWESNNREREEGQKQCMCIQDEY